MALLQGVDWSRCPWGRAIRVRRLLPDPVVQAAHGTFLPISVAVQIFPPRSWVEFYRYVTGGVCFAPERAVFATEMSDH